MGDMPASALRDLANRNFGTWKALVKRPRCMPFLLWRNWPDGRSPSSQEKDYTECTINIGFAPLNRLCPKSAKASPC